MSTDALNLLASFAALPSADQQAVAAEIARLAVPSGNDASADVNTDQRQGAVVDPSAIEETSSDDGELLPYDQWIVELRKWGRSHTIHNPNLDVSRESIYD